MDVYISRPDGSETRPLAATPADERAAGWVEGGARLLVSRSVADEGSGTGGLDLVSVAGATTPFAANAFVYGISPDGTEVVYGGEWSGGNDQLKLQATDSLIPLTISPVFSLQAVLSARYISAGGP